MFYPTAGRRSSYPVIFCGFFSSCQFPSLTAAVFRASKSVTMKFSFLPKEKIFYALLEKLALKAEEAVKLFKVLVDSWKGSHPAIQGLIDLEHECDQIVHEIMVKLNKTFVTPIDREDIHLLAKNIDDLVDIVHALSKRMVLFHIQEIKPSLKEMTAILEKAASTLVNAIKKIRDLENSQELFDDCIQIHTFENQGDRAYEMALAQLFQDSPDPLEVIKWKDIYDFIEQAIDKCEDISDILWGIGVKYG